MTLVAKRKRKTQSVGLRTKQLHGMGGPVVDPAKCIVDRIRQEQQHRRQGHRCKLWASITRLHEAARMPWSRHHPAHGTRMKSHAVQAIHLALQGATLGACGDAQSLGFIAELIHKFGILVESCRIIEPVFLVAPHQAATMAQFQVFCRGIEGATITVDVCSSNTIGDVKAKILVKTGVSTKEQSLVFAGKLLDDAQSVKDYGIENEATLHLRGRLLGSGSGEDQASSSGGAICGPLIPADQVSPNLGLALLSGRGLVALVPYNPMLAKHTARTF